LSKRTKIILASSSPRRKKLLKMLLSNLGLTFKTVAAGIEENHRNTGNDFGSLVKKISKQKAKEVSRNYRGLIIAADTVVVLNGQVIGKPASPKDAVEILKKLSGKTHSVYTGITFLDNVHSKMNSTFEQTFVTFRKLKSREITSYVNSGSPMDKAGAYGIQDDFGCTFIKKIEGDYFNVVGLPIMKTYLGLKRFIKMTSG
jgi:septum formation protein